MTATRTRMNDYGAGGAELFDIVNVQMDAAPDSGPFSKLALISGAAPRSFCQFSLGWLSSSGRALAS